VVDRSSETWCVVGLIPQFVDQLTFVASGDCGYEVIPILNVRYHRRTDIATRKGYLTCSWIGRRPRRYEIGAHEEVKSVPAGDANPSVHFGPIEDTFLRFHIRPASPLYFSQRSDRNRRPIGIVRKRHSKEG